MTRNFGINHVMAVHIPISISYRLEPHAAFFAQPVRCQLSFARFKATLWWNSLSEELVTAGNFSDNLAILYLATACS